MNTKLLTRSFVAAGAALVLGAAPTTASAATLMFNLTSQSILTSGSGANAIKYTTATISGVDVRISAWTMSGTSGNGTIAKSTLAQYGSNGLGAISSNDSSSNSTHTVDNKDTRDFLLFQFDQAVKLTEGKFTPFAVGNNGTDIDFTVGFGNSASPWTTQANLTGVTSAGLATLMSGGLTNYTVSGGSTTRPFNAGGYGNMWMIGASFANPDRVTDAFKFSKLKVVTAPVPEAATWMMMIVGFGAVGTTMRRKRGFAKPLAA